MQYAPLFEQADQFLWYEYIVKNVAKRHSKTVTFVPKPVFQDNGSSCDFAIALMRQDPRPPSVGPRRCVCADDFDCHFETVGYRTAKTQLIGGAS